MKNEEILSWPASNWCKRESHADASHRRLVVDDDDIHPRLLSADGLVGFGYGVDTAEDAAGWETLPAICYDPDIAKILRHAANTCRMNGD